MIVTPFRPMILPYIDSGTTMVSRTIESACLCNLSIWTFLLRVFSCAGVKVDASGGSLPGGLRLRLVSCSCTLLKSPNQQPLGGGKLGGLGRRTWWSSASCWRASLLFFRSMSIISFRIFLLSCVRVEEDPAERSSPSPRQFEWQLTSSRRLE